LFGPKLFNPKTNKMKTKNVMVGTLVAGVLLFLLGWLIYGMLLRGFMEANCTQTMNRPMEEMIWWAAIVANLAWGMLIAQVLVWKGSLTAADGAKTAAILGALMVLAYDLMMYSMTTMFSNLTVVVVDIVCNMVMFAIAGAGAAWAMSRMNRAPAQA
jgi:hypothetical protein